MPFSFTTKTMVFSYTPGVNVKKDASKEIKEKTGGKETEGKSTVKDKVAEGPKPWMSAL